MSTINSKTYTLVAHQSGRAEFISATHIDSNKDILLITSSDPKRGGDNYGNRRASVKFVRQTVVPGITTGITIARDSVLGLTSSLPVGMTDAEVTALANDMAGLLGDPVLLKDILVRGKLI